MLIGCAEMLFSEIEDWAPPLLWQTLEPWRWRDLTRLPEYGTICRPIGSFQVWHSMVEVLSDVEFARSMVYWTQRSQTSMGINVVKRSRLRRMSIRLRAV